MRRRPCPLLVLGFVAIMIALWIAHDPPDPTASRALKDTATRLREFYTETPQPPDWRIDAIAIQGSEVWVDLALPAAEVSALTDALGARCPPKADLAWRLLRPRQDIQVRGLAPDGRVLAAVSCRHAGS